MVLHGETGGGTPEPVDLEQEGAELNGENHAANPSNDESSIVDQTLCLVTAKDANLLPSIADDNPLANNGCSPLPTNRQSYNELSNGEFKTVKVIDEIVKKVPPPTNGQQSPENHILNGQKSYDNHEDQLPTQDSLDIIQGLGPIASPLSSVEPILVAEEEIVPESEIRINSEVEKSDDQTSQVPNNDQEIVDQAIQINNDQEISQPSQSEPEVLSEMKVKEDETEEDQPPPVPIKEKNRKTAVPVVPPKGDVSSPDPMNAVESLEINSKPDDEPHVRVDIESDQNNAANEGVIGAGQESLVEETQEGKGETRESDKVSKKGQSNKKSLWSRFWSSSSKKSPKVEPLQSVESTTEVKEIVSSPQESSVSRSEESSQGTERKNSSQETFRYIDEDEEARSKSQQLNGSRKASNVSQQIGIQIPEQQVKWSNIEEPVAEDGKKPQGTNGKLASKSVTQENESEVKNKEASADESTSEATKKKAKKSSHKRTKSKTHNEIDPEQDLDDPSQEVAIELTPTHKLIRVKTPYFRCFISFGVLVIVLAIVAIASLYVFPHHVAYYSSLVATSIASAATNGYKRLQGQAIPWFALRGHQISGPTTRSIVMITGGNRYCRQQYRGLLEDGNVAVFRGIPYAQPPTEERRWQPPVPIICHIEPTDASSSDPKQEIPLVEAFEAKPYCFQDTIQGFNASFSEDCLYLNVWSPNFFNLEENEDNVTATAGQGSALPVIVYFPGSSYTGLDAYDLQLIPNGSHFARLYNAIFVMATHRMGVFGFMALKSLAMKNLATRTSGNYGLMDQIQALKWVQENIKHFGGDPKRVTLLGHGSGGLSALLLATNEAINSDGQLFQRLWASNPYPVSLNQEPLDKVYEANMEFVRKLGCEASAHTKPPSISSLFYQEDEDNLISSCLLKKSAKELVEATPQSWFDTLVNENVEGMEPRHPIVVVDDVVVTGEQPWERQLVGQMEAVIGVNSQEAAFYPQFDVGSIESEDELKTIIKEKLMKASLNSISDTDFEQFYPLVEENYVKRAENESFVDIYYSIISDMNMVCPLQRKLDVLSNGSEHYKLFFYVNDYRPLGKVIIIDSLASASAPSNQKDEIQIDNQNGTTSTSSPQDMNDDDELQDSVAFRGLDMATILDTLGTRFIQKLTHTDIEYQITAQKHFSSFIHFAQPELAAITNSQFNQILNNGTLITRSFNETLCTKGIWPPTV